MQGNSGENSRTVQKVSAVSHGKSLKPEKGLFRGGLKSEKLKRIVPVSSVPALRWASGARESQSRTGYLSLMRAFGRLDSTSCPSGTIERTPV